VRERERERERESKKSGFKRRKRNVWSLKKMKSFLKKYTSASGVVIERR
jgi:hypothetical protein